MANNINSAPMVRAQQYTDNGDGTYSAASGGAVSGSVAMSDGVTAAQKATVDTHGSQQTVLRDSSGNEIVVATTVATDNTGLLNTYSATMVAQAAAAAATDIFTITGSATKTVKVRRFGVSGIATAVGTQQVNLIKRSVADTVGTSAAVMAVPHSSANAAVTATVLQYSVSPTLGAAVGTVRSAALPLGAAAAVGGGEKEWIFGAANDQPIVLSGIAQVLALNLNAAIVTGAVITAWVEWTEE